MVGDERRLLAEAISCCLLEVCCHRRVAGAPTRPGKRVVGHLHGEDVLEDELPVLAEGGGGQRTDEVAHLK